MPDPGKPQLQQEIEKAVAQLRTIRDEVRVRLHLAGQDVQEAWKKLEPGLGDLEQKVTQVSDATKAKAQELLKRFSEVRDRLKKEPAKK